MERDIDALEAITNDLCKIGLENLKNITDFTFVSLSSVDEKDRTVEIVVELDAGYGAVPLKFKSDLVGFETESPMTTLPELYTAFSEAVPRYSHFWDVCDSVDEKCWVVEPTDPKMTDTDRRIVVNSNTTLKISVDPVDPSDFPILQIFGPDEIKARLQNNVNMRRDMWDENGDFVRNLEAVLDLKLPAKSEESQSSVCEPTCGICLTGELEGLFPEVNCEGENCGQTFHRMCFVDYVETLPNALRTRHMITGECPYCSTRLSC